MSYRDGGKAIVVELWQAIRRVVFTLGVVLVIGLLALALALPLWAFSVYEPGAYTAFALGLLAAGVLFLLVRRAVRRSREAGGVGAWIRLRILPAVKAIALAIVLLLAAYGAVLLLARGRLLIGVLAGAGVVLSAGYLRFARRSRRPSRRGR